MSCGIPRQHWSMRPTPSLPELLPALLPAELSSPLPLLFSSLSARSLLCEEPSLPQPASLPLLPPEPPLPPEPAKIWPVFVPQRASCCSVTYA